MGLIARGETLALRPLGSAGAAPPPPPAPNLPVAGLIPAQSLTATVAMSPVPLSGEAPTATTAVLDPDSAAMGLYISGDGPADWAIVGTPSVPVALRLAYVEFSDGALTGRSVFGLAVAAAPRVPLAAVGSIPAQALTVGTPAQIDLSAYFAGLAGATLSASGAAWASIAPADEFGGPYLTLVPTVAVGSAVTVTVTAGNGVDADATQAVSVTADLAVVAADVIVSLTRIAAPVSVSSASADFTAPGTITLSAAAASGGWAESQTFSSDSGGGAANRGWMSKADAAASGAGFYAVAVYDIVTPGPLRLGVRLQGAAGVTTVYIDSNSSGVFSLGTGTATTGLAGTTGIIEVLSTYADGSGLHIVLMRASNIATSGTPWAGILRVSLLSGSTTVVATTPRYVAIWSDGAPAVASASILPQGALTQIAAVADLSGGPNTANVNRWILEDGHAVRIAVDGAATIIPLREIGGATSISIDWLARVGADGATASALLNGRPAVVAPPTEIAGLTPYVDPDLTDRIEIAGLRDMTVVLHEATLAETARIVSNSVAVPPDLTSFARDTSGGFRIWPMEVTEKNYFSLFTPNAADNSAPADNRARWVASYVRSAAAPVSISIASVSRDTQMTFPQVRAIASRGDDQPTCTHRVTLRFASSYSPRANDVVTISLRDESNTVLTTLSVTYGKDAPNALTQTPLAFHRKGRKLAYLGRWLGGAPATNSNVQLGTTTPLIQWQLERWSGSEWVVVSGYGWQNGSLRLTAEAEFQNGALTDQDGENMTGGYVRWQVDLSGVETAGRYRLVLRSVVAPEGDLERDIPIGCSHPFEIGQAAVSALIAKQARFFFHIRNRQVFNASNTEWMQNTPRPLTLGPNEYQTNAQPHRYSLATQVRRRPDGIMGSGSSTSADRRQDFTTAIAASLGGLNTGTATYGSVNSRAKFGALMALALRASTDRLTPILGWRDAADWDTRAYNLEGVHSILIGAALSPRFAALSWPLPDHRRVNRTRNHLGIDTLFLATADLPDYLLEAIGEVDHFGSIQKSNGGVRGGAEIHGYISGRGEMAGHNPSALQAQEDAFCLFDSDPWTSMAFASSAAHVAIALKARGETALAALYEAEAVAAWNYAKANDAAFPTQSLQSNGALPLDTAYTVDMRNDDEYTRQVARAAACLYALTGTTTYYQAFEAEVARSYWNRTDRTFRRVSLAVYLFVLFAVDKPALSSGRSIADVWTEVRAEMRKHIDTGGVRTASTVQAFGQWRDGDAVARRLTGRTRYENSFGQFVFASQGARWAVLPGNGLTAAEVAAWSEAAARDLSAFLGANTWGHAIMAGVDPRGPRSAYFNDWQLFGRPPPGCPTWGMNSWRHVRSYSALSNLDVVRSRQYPQMPGNTTAEPVRPFGYYWAMADGSAAISEWSVQSVVENNIVGLCVADALLGENT